MKETNELIITPVMQAYLAKWEEPDFFLASADQNLAAVHAEVQQFYQHHQSEDDYITVDVNEDAFKTASKALGAIGWAPDEACCLLMLWCIERPEQYNAWQRKWTKGDLESCSISPETRTVSLTGFDIFLKDFIQPVMTP